MKEIFAKIVFDKLEEQVEPRHTAVLNHRYAERFLYHRGGISSEWQGFVLNPADYSEVKNVIRRGAKK